MAVNTKSGVVLAIGQPQQITSKGGKTFTKRSILLDCTTFDPYTGERSQFENKILFEFMENKVSLLDNVQVGQVAKVSFDLQGSEITDELGQKKYFTHVRPFGIEVRQVRQQQTSQQYVPQNGVQPAPQQSQMEDNMPF